MLFRSTPRSAHAHPGTKGASTVSMNPALIADSAEADLEKIAKVGRGKRDLILIAALAGVGGLLGAVAAGFRGSDVTRSADAMTAPVPPAAWKLGPRSTKPQDHPATVSAR